MKYLLDTDTIIFFLKNNLKVVQNFANADIDDLNITLINYAELLYGAYNSVHPEKHIHQIRLFLKNIRILEFDKSSAEIFAKQKARLKKTGKLIADMDLIIASICITNNLTLVTNNVRHYNRLSELNVINWTIDN